jgi:hypothetical protein
MKNTQTSSYSHLYNTRWGLEFELRNSLEFYIGDDKTVILEYFKRRINELKEEEKQCLRTQTL